MAYDMNTAYNYGRSRQRQSDIFSPVFGSDNPYSSNTPSITATPERLKRDMDNISAYNSAARAPSAVAPSSYGNVPTAAPAVPRTSFTPQAIMDKSRQFDPGLDDNARLDKAYNALSDADNDPMLRGLRQDTADINSRLATSRDMTLNPQNYAQPGRTSAGNVGAIDGGGSFSQVGPRAGGGLGFNGIVGSRIGAPRVLTSAQQQFGANEDATQHDQRMKDIAEAALKGVKYRDILNQRQARQDQAAAQARQDDQRQLDRKTAVDISNARNAPRPLTLEQKQMMEADLAVKQSQIERNKYETGKPYPKPFEHDDPIIKRRLQVLAGVRKTLDGALFSASEADKPEIKQRIADLEKMQFEISGIQPGDSPPTNTPPPTGTNTPPTGGSKPPEITTKQQFDALPSGSTYTENGKRFRKP